MRFKSGESGLSLVRVGLSLVRVGFESGSSRFVSVRVSAPGAASG